MCVQSLLESSDYCIAIHQRARAIAEAEAEVEDQGDHDDDEEDELVYPSDDQSGVANDDADEALFSATFSSKSAFFFLSLGLRLTYTSRSCT